MTIGGQFQEKQPDFSLAVTAPDQIQLRHVGYFFSVFRTRSGFRGLLNQDPDIGSLKKISSLKHHNIIYFLKPYWY